MSVTTDIDVDAVQVGTVLRAPNQDPGRDRYVVIDETRQSWIVCPEVHIMSCHAGTLSAYLRTKIAKDTMRERGNTGHGYANAPWVTIARAEHDREVQAYRRLITQEIGKSGISLELLRQVAGLIGAEQST